MFVILSSVKSEANASLATLNAAPRPERLLNASCCRLCCNPLTRGNAVSPSIDESITLSPVSSLEPSRGFFSPAFRLNVRASGSERDHRSILRRDRRPPRRASTPRETPADESAWSVMIRCDFCYAMLTCHRRRPGTGSRTRRSFPRPFSGLCYISIRSYTGVAHP